MSGHSHARTVLHRKQSEDEKRGKIFSKLARLISVAAKDGTDPATNSKLKQAIEEAKRYNLPKDNIEKAVKKGSGEMESENLEEVNFEVFGPGGTALIVEGITDNKNRTLSEIKQILQKHNAKLADEGSVRWLFEKKGLIELRNTKGCEYTKKDKEDLELKIIETGADDFRWRQDEEGEFLEVITKPEELEKVKKALRESGFKIETSSLDWLAKKEIEVSEKDKQACLKLFEVLDENDAIQNIYSNLQV